MVKIRFVIKTKENKMRIQLLLILALLLAGCKSKPLPTLIYPTGTIQTSTPFQPLPPTPEPTITSIPPTATANAPIFEYSMMVLGGDYEMVRFEEGQVAEHTDTMIYIKIVAYHDTPVLIKVFSIPRDLYLEVPCAPDSREEEKSRINSAYAWGGFNCVRGTFSWNFGEDIDGPIFYTTFAWFIALVDKIGGIEVNVLEDYSGTCGRYKVKGSTYEEKTWNAFEVYNMDGSEALCYIRDRTGRPDGDIDRGRRAIEVLRALGDGFADEVIERPEVLLDLWRLASDYVISDIDLYSIDDYIRAAYEIKTKGYRFQWYHMGLDVVEYHKSPVYGASVLLPTVDLRGWFDCAMNDDNSWVAAWCEEEWRLDDSD
jgi:LCP family protein required for cell wall assembly